MTIADLGLRARRLLIGAAVWAAVPGGAAAGSWTVDPERSELVVFLAKDGFASGMAHDHVVWAPAPSGRAEYDPAEPERASIEVHADARRLVADPPQLIAKYAVDNDADDGDRAKIGKTMKGRSQLDVERYPSIRFTSTSVTRAGERELVLRGLFTLRGVTREVSCPIALRREEDGSLAGTCEFRVRQSEFGYKPYKAFLGAVRVKDEVRIRAALVLVPAVASAPDPAPGD